MLLLHSSTIPVVEYASISLLLKDDSTDKTHDNDASSTTTNGSMMGEAIIVASPLSSTTTHEEQLVELHDNLQQQQKQQRRSAVSNTKSVVLAKDQLLRDDWVWQQQEQDESLVQIYRPTRGHGMGLYYRVVRQSDFTKACWGVLLQSSSSSSTTSSNHHYNKKSSSHRRRGGGSNVCLDAIDGVVVCLGVSGLSGTSLSSQTQQIVRRIQDTIVTMKRIGSLPDLGSSSADTTQKCYKALQSTLLLTDDEDQRTNAMVRASAGGLVLQQQQQQHEATPASTTTTTTIPLSSSSSSEWAHLLEKASAVLSVVDNETMLRKYDTDGGQRRRTAAMDVLGKRSKRRRKLAENPDLDAFDYRPITTTKLEPLNQQQQRRRQQQQQQQQGQQLQLQQANDKPRIKDTIVSQSESCKKGTASARTVTKRGSVPMIAPPPQQRGRSRRVRPAAAGQSSSSHDRAAQTSPKSRTTAVTTGESTDDDDDNNNNNNNNKTPPRERSSTYANTFDPFAIDTNPSNSVNSGSPTNTTNTDFWASETSAWIEPLMLEENSDKEERENEDTSIDTRRLLDSSSNLSSSSIINAIRGRMHINLAQMENIVCSYQRSRMASCIVTGMIQVQVVQSDKQKGTPFLLMVRDPLRHIRLIQEKGKFAKNLSEEVDDRCDYKFALSIPSNNTDTHFSVVRYKCSTELRPMPIRVQSRVRVSGGYCRVTLQVSSNPVNAQPLTDITLSMDVPADVVRGETLESSPPIGGVWHAAKSSVVWRVTDIGVGQKILLHARFVMAPQQQQEEETLEDNGDTSSSLPKKKPEFPVVVRCQSFNALLSEVELEVTDIPEFFPADVTVRFNRKFSVTHRERP